MHAKRIKIFLVLVLGVTMHLNSQSITNKIIKALEVDSISYEKVDVEIGHLGKIESIDQKIILAKVSYFRKFVLYDIEQDKLRTLESRRLHSNYGNIRFAKFYADRFVIGYSDFFGNEYIEQFDFDGNSIHFFVGIIPGNQNTNRYDIDNNMIVCITQESGRLNGWSGGSIYKIWRYDLEIAKLIELAELPSDVESVPLGGRRTRNLPLLRIDSLKKEIVLVKYRSDSKVIDESEEYFHRIKPVFKCEEDEKEIMFKY